MWAFWGGGFIIYFGHTLWNIEDFAQFYTGLNQKYTHFMLCVNSAN